jgi:hypothetical protein
MEIVMKHISLYFQFLSARLIKTIVPMLLLFVSENILAQTMQPQAIDKNKHEICFSYGIFPFVGMNNPQFGGGNLLLPRFNPFTTSIGSFSLDYLHHLFPIHGIGFAAYYASRYGEQPEFLGSTLKGREIYGGVLIEYQFTYNRKKNRSYYAAFRSGVTWAKQDRSLMREGQKGDHWMFIAYQLTFLGLRIGNADAFKMELGFGTLGIIRLGYSRKF